MTRTESGRDWKSWDCVLGSREHLSSIHNAPVPTEGFGNPRFWDNASHLQPDLPLSQLPNCSIRRPCHHRRWEAPILGYGDVDILVDGPNGRRILRLYGAAYCENFACNLVSLRKLLARGFWWDTRPENNCIRHADGDEILCSVHEAQDQFVLEYLPKEHSQQAFFARRNKFNSWTERKPQAADAKTWHLRLGHPGPGALEHLVNSTQGARIKGITTVQCDGCGLGKKRRRVRREQRDIEGGPGMRLAVDFHDFEPDPHGYKSLMLVTDRWSGYMWDYYMERRTPKLSSAHWNT